MAGDRQPSISSNPDGKVMPGLPHLSFLPQDVGNCNSLAKFPGGFSPLWGYNPPPHGPWGPLSQFSPKIFLYYLFGREGGSCRMPRGHANWGCPRVMDWGVRGNPSHTERYLVATPGKRPDKGRRHITWSPVFPSWPNHSPSYFPCDTTPSITMLPTASFHVMSH